MITTVTLRKTLVFLLVLTSLNASANIFYIRIEKIPGFEKYGPQFEFLGNNVKYFNHWTPSWNYKANKDSLVAGLKRCYTTFAKLDSGNVELELLLGDISHYLYNLNQESYAQTAIGHYNKSIELAPDDFRPLWFLGNHYTLANIQDKSVDLFFKAQSKLPEDVYPDFWNEYAMATAIANMPSHTIFAMDKARAILKEPGYFEEQVGETVRKRIKPSRADSVYVPKDLW
jgi:hypothetical protein